MLKHLSIKNLLLIDQIDFVFNQGLSVLTGETGAGKSMILDSLNIVSGYRLKSSFKPPKGKKTSITALFNIENFSSIKTILEEIEIEYSEEILIKRIISEDGKSKAFINDNLVSLNSLKLISNELMEVQSQFSEQGLLDNSSHIKTLDEYGNYNSEIMQLRSNWESMKESEKQYMDFVNKDEDLVKKRESINFDLKEIKELVPKKNEFFELTKKKKILQNSAKINESLSQINNNFSSDEPDGIEKLMTKNLNLFKRIYDLLDKEQKQVVNSLESLSIEISDISETIKNFSNITDNFSSLEEIDERLFQYKKISRKHGVNEDSLEDLMQALNKELNSLENHDEHLKNLQNQYELEKSKYLSCARNISKLRKMHALDMDAKINKELPSLKLENAVFKTFIEENQSSQKGFDKVTFKIKTNPKADMDDLKNISSGGELCRFALAVKVISQRNSKSGIVFDEVDSGIGGAISTAVGERLRKLGKNRQVIVVTHSPQVAVLGKDHFLVKKKIIMEV